MLPNEAFTVMHRLIYTSTASVLPGPGMLESILLAARRNNTRSEVTGLLIYHEGCYLQILEGSEPAVHATLSRIKRDRRHTGLIVLSDSAVPDRLFGSWRMASLISDELSPLQKRQLVDLRLLAKAVSTGDSLKDQPATRAVLLAFLSSFRDLEIVA